MKVSKLQFLPLVLGIVYWSTLIISYSMAVSAGHVKPFIPYISDTGTLPPESYVFGFLLNVIAILLAFLVYIRYKQVQEFSRTKNANSLNKINVTSSIFGYATCLGVSMVGFVPETEAILPHIIGAFMAFEIGAVYMIFQAYFTFKMVPLFTSKRIAYLRLVIGITCATLFFVTLVAGLLSFSQYEQSHTFVIELKYLTWEPSHSGWGLHVVSVLAEWIMAALFNLYIFTVMIDFRKLRFEGSKVIFCMATVSPLSDLTVVANSSHDHVVTAGSQNSLDVKSTSIDIHKHKSSPSHHTIHGSPKNIK